MGFPVTSQPVAFTDNPTFQEPLETSHGRHAQSWPSMNGIYWGLVIRAPDTLSAASGSFR
jgi:hypothetical protein